MLMCHLMTQLISISFEQISSTPNKTRARCLHWNVNAHQRPYLCRPSIHHWRWKDGNDSGLWIQDTFLQHGSVLLHPPGQRHIVILGPSSQWVEQQHGSSVASLDEALVGVLHQKSMAVVDWVAELKCKHGVWRKEKKELLHCFKKRVAGFISSC